MKVYVSGPITGVEGYMERFNEAEEALLAAGHTPMNPVEIVNLPEDSEWSDYMKVDLKVLELCDAIYMLKGWPESRGAMIEFEYAYENRKIICFEGGEIPNA